MCRHRLKRAAHRRPHAHRLTSCAHTSEETASAFCTRAQVLQQLSFQRVQGLPDVRRRLEPHLHRTARGAAGAQGSERRGKPDGQEWPLLPNRGRRLIAGTPLVAMAACHPLRAFPPSAGTARARGRGEGVQGQPHLRRGGLGQMADWRSRPRPSLGVARLPLRRAGRARLAGAAGFGVERRRNRDCAREFPCRGGIRRPGA